MLRSDVVVAEPPPPFGNAEDQVGPHRRVIVLHQRQQPLGRQECSDMLEGLAHVACRVQHIGSQDQVEAVGGKPLGERVALEVQQLVPHERILPEPLLGLREKERRDIRET